LDAYGDWSHTAQYGWVWRPHVTVINHYHDWAPYRYGRWRWCPPYGWTWVADEDWGWAPYHYGRWVYYNNNWCWAPRGYGYDYRRAWWRPALVAFIYVPTSSGEHVAWYPLGHGQRDPRGRQWPRSADRTALFRNRGSGYFDKSKPGLMGAVTSVPVRDFGVDSIRARAASGEFARRALAAEPVPGKLPITPEQRAGARTPDNARPAVLGSKAAAREAKGAGTTAEAGAGTPTAGREPLRIFRPAPAGPSRILPERKTGAATRTPGVALDESLRGARVFNGRDVKINQGKSVDDGDGGRATGIVNRPARVPKSAAPARGEDSGNSAPVRRPTSKPEFERRWPAGEPDARTPTRDTPKAVRERADDGDGSQAEPRARPYGGERPSRQPQVYERPAPSERAKPEAVERPSAPRYEPPARTEKSEPRSEPPAQSKPEKQSPPQKSEPPSVPKPSIVGRKEKP
jgi:hypothetical protein